MTSVIPLHLETTVKGASDLLARVYPNGRTGGITVPGNCPGAVGQAVELLVKVVRPRRDFVVVGLVAWARRKGSDALAQSYGIEFRDDDAGAQRLMAFARDEVSGEALRAHTRFTVELPARLVCNGQTRKENLADLSLGGAFVRTWNPLDVGDGVEVIVRPPRSLSSFRFAGRVAWARRSGTDAGFGIEFDDASGQTREDVQKLLTKLGAR